MAEQADRLPKVVHSAIAASEHCRYCYRCGTCNGFDFNMVGNNPDVIVRPVRPADEAQWRRMWTAYLDYYKTSVPEQVYATAFSRLLSEEGHEFRGRIAEVDGRPVGLVHYLFHRHMWKVEDTCYLQDLYADADVRGQGVGRALIEAVYAEADAAGCPSVYWLTQDFNATARQLYDRIGKLTPFIRYNRG